MSAWAVLAVFGGAGVGACLRWLLSQWLNPLWPLLPLGTLAANLFGGLLVGVCTAWFSHHSNLPVEWRLLLITGFLGGLTTFSTFSAEVVTLLLRHEPLWALGTATLHLAGSLLLTALGLGLGHALAARPVPGAG